MEKSSRFTLIVALFGIQVCLVDVYCMETKGNFGRTLSTAEMITLMKRTHEATHSWRHGHHPILPFPLVLKPLISCNYEETSRFLEPHDVLQEKIGDHIFKNFDKVLMFILLKNKFDYKSRLSSDLLKISDTSGIGSTMELPPLLHNFGISSLHSIPVSSEDYLVELNNRPIQNEGNFGSGKLLGDVLFETNIRPSKHREKFAFGKSIEFPLLKHHPTYILKETNKSVLLEDNLTKKNSSYAQREEKHEHEHFTNRENVYLTSDLNERSSTKLENGEDLSLHSSLGKGCTILPMSHENRNVETFSVYFPKQSRVPSNSFRSKVIPEPGQINKKSTEHERSANKFPSVAKEESINSSSKGVLHQNNPMTCTQRVDSEEIISNDVSENDNRANNSEILLLHFREPSEFEEYIDKSDEDHDRPNNVNKSKFRKVAKGKNGSKEKHYSAKSKELAIKNMAQRVQEKLHSIQRMRRINPKMPVVYHPSSIPSEFKVPVEVSEGVSTSDARKLLDN